MRTMTLTVLSTDGTTLPVPVTVTVPKYGKFKDLIQALSTACSLSDDESLLVAEVYNNRILHFMDKPGDSLELVRDHDRLVAYRVLKDEDSLPLVVFTHWRPEETYGLRVPVLKKFGIPLVARVPNSTNGSDIHNKFLKLLHPLIMPDEFSLEYPENSPDQDPSEMDVDEKEVNESIDEKEVNESIDEKEVNESIDEKEVDDSSNGVVKVNENFRFFLDNQGLFSDGPTIIMDEPLSIPESPEPRKLSIGVSWSDDLLKRYDTSILSNLPETGGLAYLTKTPPESVSLYKCLEAFLKEEPLGPEDMWYCPKCKDHRQASKKLDLWRLPEIVIIHLKRFSYNRFLKDKLETFVDFPIDDFDVSNYTVEKDSQSCFRYKLYAVSNHYGGMGGGHYTAFAQCGEEWYEFNDSQVYPISEDQIKTSAAYVLFYKRV